MNVALWLPLSVAAYTIFSFNGIIDKIVVSKKVKNPLMVSFWVSAMGWITGVILLLGLLPGQLGQALRLHIPPLSLFATIAGGEIVLQLGLLLQYSALKRGEATRVISVIGASMPVFAFGFAYWLLHERLEPWGYTSFVVLVAGAVLMLARRGRWPVVPFMLAVGGAACMAFQTVVARYVYQHNPFISSLILFGVGDMIYNSALFLLLPQVRRGVRQAIRQTRRMTPRRRAHSSAAWIITNAVLGGIGIVCVNLALKYGPASLVNALKGLQYAIVFLIVLMLSRYRPKLLREELTGQTMRQKLVGIGVIGAGLGLLTILGR